MYTGFIVEVGKVAAAGRALRVQAPLIAEQTAVGSSVSVAGICMSVVARDAGSFWCEPSTETRRRSTVDDLGVGDNVNLELPLRAGDAIEGHLVQGHVDAVGKVTKIVDEPGGTRRAWIRPPRRFLDDLIPKGSIAVDGVSLTIAELLSDRFSVALVPITLAETSLGELAEGDRVNLESDMLVKTTREGMPRARSRHAAASLTSLAWAGELTGASGIQKAASQLAAGGGVVVYDPDREGEADVVFAGSVLRPEAFVFLLTEVCGHTTVPCDRRRLESLQIPPMPGDGDPLGTAYHVSVDLADAGTGVSAHERAATVRRLAHPDARPADFRQPGHVFPLAGRDGGLDQRRGHTEASLALCRVGGLPSVAVINEVMGLDGHMLTGAAVERYALRHGLPLVAIDEIVAHA